MATAVRANRESEAIKMVGDGGIERARICSKHWKIARSSADKIKAEM